MSFFKQLQQLSFEWLAWTLIYLVLIPLAKCQGTSLPYQKSGVDSEISCDKLHFIVINQADIFFPPDRCLAFFQNNLAFAMALKNFQADLEILSAKCNYHQTCEIEFSLSPGSHDLNLPCQEYLNKAMIGFKCFPYITAENSAQFGDFRRVQAMAQGYITFGDVLRGKNISQMTITSGKHQSYIPVYIQSIELDMLDLRQYESASLDHDSYCLRVNNATKCSVRNRASLIYNHSSNAILKLSKDLHTRPDLLLFFRRLSPEPDNFESIHRAQRMHNFVWDWLVNILACIGVAFALALILLTLLYLLFYKNEHPINQDKTHATATDKIGNSKVFSIEEETESARLSSMTEDWECMQNTSNQDAQVPPTITDSCPRISFSTFKPKRKPNTPRKFLDMSRFKETNPFNSPRRNAKTIHLLEGLIQIAQRRS